jgi:hypothetical protein
MIASPDDTRGASPTGTTSPAAPPDPISARQRRAHLLVLDIINANLPLARLADHLKIPFDTLIAHVNTPEVQAEIDAYEQLNNLRARLLGEAARPISLRKLLDVLESPTPRLTGRDPDADQCTLHRHAELIRRTATTIARESRALAPKPVLAPKLAAAPKPAADRRSQKGAPSASSGSTSGDSPTPSNDHSRQKVPSVPAEHTSVSEAELVRDISKPAPTSAYATPSRTPGRQEAPMRSSRADALRVAAGSTHIVRDPSRRARDRPAA